MRTLIANCPWETILWLAPRKRVIWLLQRPDDKNLVQYLVERNRLVWKGRNEHPALLLLKFVADSHKRCANNLPVPVPFPDSILPGKGPNTRQIFTEQNILVRNKCCFSMMMWSQRRAKCNCPPVFYWFWMVQQIMKKFAPKRGSFQQDVLCTVPPAQTKPLTVLQHVFSGLWRENKFLEVPRARLYCLSNSVCKIHPSDKEENNSHQSTRNLAEDHQGLQIFRFIPAEFSCSPETFSLKQNKNCQSSVRCLIFDSTSSVLFDHGAKKANLLFCRKTATKTSRPRSIQIDKYFRVSFHCRGFVLCRSLLHCGSWKCFWIFVRIMQGYKIREFKLRTAKQSFLCHDRWVHYKRGHMNARPVGTVQFLKPW